MSATSNVDTILSEYKLSDAQKNAVLELLDTKRTGPLTARSNTLESLRKKGLVVGGQNGWELSKSFLAVASPVVEQNQAVFEAFDAVADIQDELNTNPWDSAAQADTFDSSLGVYANKLLGFGEVYNWNNYKVWDGLTATEIREDMDTARHISRQERRKFDRVTAKLVKKGVLV